MQADLKTFHRFEVYGASVLTLITAQNSREVERVEVLDASLVQEQLQVVLSDLSIGAAKTGALGSADNVATIAEAVRATSCSWVVDPVVMSSSGARLLDEGAQQLMRDQLFPAATLVTPNVVEAQWLTGRSIESVEAAQSAALEIAAMGPAVLLKGGHLVEPSDRVVDIFCRGKAVTTLAHPRLTVRARGTGCALSAAITSELALGASLEAAVHQARQWLQGALVHAIEVGAGNRSVNHFFELPPKT